MHIHHVTIQVPNPDRTARFFSEALKAPVIETARGITVTIGRSRLTLEQGHRHPNGYYHLAFDIPENAITEAHDRLRHVVEILPAGDDGIVTTSPSWNAHSVYFNAPGNLNLELIACHRLPNATSRPFGFPDIQNISEVGVPVANPLEATEELRTAFGLESFQEPSETFAPVGGDDGLIILVKTGRIWFPTDDQSTTDRPLSVEIDGPKRQLMVGEHATISSA